MVPCIMAPPDAGDIAPADRCDESGEGRGCTFSAPVAFGADAGVCEAAQDARNRKSAPSGRSEKKRCIAVRM
ncbi:hypothetical protein KDI_48040 [Dictyobacter arantiisoli]|uniref:Uncharacterized protein n=1 Tax=Dictyobacter arantiisoli TaxID=2014874 RepID=A0A5A5TI22_9CHLR|nr:hypothetical protein KDI_48040 [Dictyobacter arantiisoli]